MERRLKDKTEKLQSVIVIETVREAIQFMHHTPSEGGWRVVIVDGAEDMNTQMANALLKILEEPPARAILLLVTAAPGRLLPTIRSRCRALALSSLPDEDVAALLADYAPELGPDERDRLIGLAEGSIGTALTLAAEGGVALAGLVDEVLAAPVSAARAQSIADTVSRSTEGSDHFETFFTLLRRLAREHPRRRPRRPAARPACGRCRALAGVREART